MKDCKFRGWDATGRKGWVYGDLAHNQKVTATGVEPRVMIGGYEVESDSVGLFTGLKDRKGREIYEEDVLRISAQCGIRYISFEAVVVWKEDMAGFLINEGEGCYSPIPADSSEVIDNVWERSLI